MIELWATLLVTSALATEGETTNWTVKKYNAVFNAESAEAMADVQKARTAALAGGTSRVERAMTDLGASLRDRREKLAGMPAYDGDTKLRDEVVAVFDELIVLHDEKLSKWADLRVKPAPTAADARQVATLFTEFDRALPPLTDRINDAQNVFFKSHGELALMLDPDDPPQPKQFEAYGIPPQGLTMPANLFMSLTTNYQAAHREQMEKTVAAFNACADIDRDADPNAYGECARQVTATCTEVQGTLGELDSSWFGEWTLHSSSVTVATACVSMAGTMEKLSERLAAGLEDQKDVDAVNALIAEIGKQRTRLNDALTKGQTAWNTKWHIDEYREYVKQVRTGKAGQE